MFVLCLQARIIGAILDKLWQTDKSLDSNIMTILLTAPSKIRSDLNIASGVNLQWRKGPLYKGPPMVDGEQKSRGCRRRTNALHVHTLTYNHKTEDIDPIMKGCSNEARALGCIPGMVNVQCSMNASCSDVDVSKIINL